MRVRIVLVLIALAASCIGGYQLGSAGARYAIDKSRPRDSAVEVSQSTLLIPSVSQLDFGTLPRGGRDEATFWLYNSGTTAVEIGEVNTSCECFSVALKKNVVAPGEKVLGMAKVDFSDDVSFVGRLNLQAVGLDQAKKETAFVVYVNVNVN